MYEDCDSEIVRASKSLCAIINIASKNDDIPDPYLGEHRKQLGQVQTCRQVIYPVQ